MLDFSYKFYIVSKLNVIINIKRNSFVVERFQTFRYLNDRKIFTSYDNFHTR